MNCGETIMIRCFSGLAAALMLSGCAGHPLPEDVTRKSTVSIVMAIRCEAGQAILKHAPDWAYEKGAIGFVFDFDITEHNHAGVNFGLTKIFPSGTFTMSVPPSTDLTREAHRRFTIIDSFKELKQAALGPSCSPEGIQSNFAYPIAGSIGLDEVIHTAIGIDKLGKAQVLTQTETGDTVPGGSAVFSDELTYQTMIDTGAITPGASFNAVPGVLRLASVSGNFQANRTDKHILTLAIALPEPPAMTDKGAVRAAARRAPAQPALLGSRGIPSKVLIHGTSSPQLRVLWELDRRALLGQEDRLINALGTTLHP
jgi:hypothetical protein